MQCCGMTKKVYIFDDYITSRRNGIGVYVRELSYCLKAAGCMVTFMMQNSDYKDFTIKKRGGMSCLCFPKFPGRYAPQINYRVINRFMRMYIEDEADNIFIFNHTPADDLMGIIRGHYKRARLVYVAHNLTWCGPLLGDACRMRQIVKYKKKSETNRRIFEDWKMQRRTMEMADAVVCLSEDTQDVLKENVLLNPAKVHLIPNGLRLGRKNTFERAALRQTYGIPEDEVILLFVGRTTEAKGIFALLKALPALKERYRNIRLAIAGSMTIFDLNAFAEIMPNVICLGYLKKEKLYQWYEMADIGMLVSYTEQCSYVGLEMMLHGLPVVASDGFGVRCMFKDGENAVTACIGSRKSDSEYACNIVDAVSDLVENDELKKKLIENGQRILRQKYSIGAMKKNYKNLLTSF